MASGSRGPLRTEMTCACGPLLLASLHGDLYYRPTFTYFFPRVIQPSRPRRIVFAALPTIAIVVVLWLVNFILPRINSSLDLPFTRDYVEGRESYLEINRAYLAPFFPAGSPMIPELRPTLVRRVKRPNTFRVLCLGESSMQGIPFDLAATIPALVRKQLRHLYPDLDIEVINLGASAINTNVIREMVPEFLSLTPDLVLVYTGHNEFYGPDGIGASWLERKAPALTPWKYRARRLPMVIGLQRWLAGSGSRASTGEKSLMKQVSGGAEVALHGPDAERIFGLFEENLRAILRMFRSEGVPVILGDISSNLMFPPFAPRHGSQSEAVVRAFAQGNLEAADSMVSAGQSADSSSAFFLYWRGRLFLATGDSVRAVQFLQRARDNDLLKFRAPGRVNEIIHELGKSESVPVLSLDSLLRSQSSHGVTDSVFFSEHLHPTFAGYDRIARAFVQSVVDGGYIRNAPPPAVRMLPFHPDSLSVPWVDLGRGALSLRALTSRWPFTEVAREHDALDSCAEWELELAKQLYAGRIGWTRGCLQYAEEARSHNKPEGVVTALSALVEDNPDNPSFRHAFAGALEEVGRNDDAILQYRKAIQLNPEMYQAALDCGLLLFNQGEYEQARKQFLKVLAAPPGGANSPSLRPAALYGLAAVAVNQDSSLSALRLLDESLRLAPGYQAALDLRAQITRKP
jgi:hypothetical protein